MSSDIIRDLPLTPPSVFGLRQSSWRPYQADALLRMADDSGARTTLLTMPTGAGKSIAAVGAALLSGRRTLINTATKGLEDQYAKEAGDIGLVDVRGAANYPCRLVDEWGYGRVGCDEGPCRSGTQCKYKADGCGYYDAIRAAAASPLVVTNYSFYMRSAEAMEDPLGTFDTLVLDESHDAPDALSDVLSFEFDHADCDLLLDTKVPDTEVAEDQWADWARYHSPRCEDAIEDYKAKLQDSWTSKTARMLRKYQTLSRQFSTLIRVTGAHDSWVIEPTKGGVKWTPLWPAAYAESTLFRSTPRIILMSATVRKETARYLGIADKDLSTVDYPSMFPVSHRPIYHLPTMQMNYRTESDPFAVRTWGMQVDRILRARPHRKGIIHTTSFKRANDYYQMSRCKERLIVPSGGGETARLVAQFKASDPREGLVLVSPSVTTGYDFPGDECEFQVIIKVPFPDLRSPVTKARCDADASYGPYLTMQTLVQAVGRGCRSAEDRCETFVTDDNIKWFLWKHKSLAPSWFLDAVKTARTIPPAPPSMREAA